MSSKKSFTRVKQLTGSYCGPAVFEMLVSGLGKKLDQEQMVEASGARKRVMIEGIPLVRLAEGLRKVYPDLRIWVKENGDAEWLKKVSDAGYLVGVDWQGVFTRDEYGDDEVDKWEDLRDRITGAPTLIGTQGHYCVVTEVDTKKGFIKFADPYGHYAGKDRFIAIWEFEERWWDDRIDKDEKGRKKYVLESRLAFIVTEKADKTPKDLGMTEI